MTRQVHLLALTAGGGRQGRPREHKAPGQAATAGVGVPRPRVNSMHRLGSSGLPRARPAVRLEGASVSKTQSRSSMGYQSRENFHPLVVFPGRALMARYAPCRVFSPSLGETDPPRRAMVQSGDPQSSGSRSRVINPPGESAPNCSPLSFTPNSFWVAEVWASFSPRTVLLGQTINRWSRARPLPGRRGRNFSKGVVVLFFREVPTDWGETISSGEITLSGGSLGSCVDEERSQLRELM